jgi:hypothetical protein
MNNCQPDPFAKVPPLAMFMLVAALFVAPVAVSTGCQSLYKSVVTITSLVDGASKSYASLYNQGLIPLETATKVAKAHLAYRQAAGVAEKALIAFKASGGTDKAAYDAAFAATLQAATEFISLVVPFFAPHDAIALQTQLKKATAL